MTAIITQNRHSEEQQPDIKGAADKRGVGFLIWCEEDKRDYVSVRTGSWVMPRTALVHFNHRWLLVSPLS